MTSRCKWNVRFVQKIIRLHDHHVTIKGGVSCLPTLNLICHCKEYKHYGMPCPVNHVARCSNLTWTLDKAHNGLIQHQTILFYESNGAWAYLWGNTDKAHNDRTDHVDVHLCFTNGSVVWMGQGQEISRQPDVSLFTRQEWLVASANWFICIFCYNVTLDDFFRKNTKTCFVNYYLGWDIYNVLVS
jgi:hypothetical protein